VFNFFRLVGGVNGR